MSNSNKPSADSTLNLLRRMFPDTSAPPSELARAQTALSLALDERSRLRKARLFDQLPAVRARIAKHRAAVKKLSSANGDNHE